MTAPRVMALLLAAALPLHATAAGRKAFAACASCHQAGPRARNAFGPQLNGLDGRKAGTVPGYSYSPALKASRIVWTKATLAAYLHDPNALVPGTKMRFWGVGISERQAADLLAYLAAPGVGR